MGSECPERPGKAATNLREGPPGHVKHLHPACGLLVVTWEWLSCGLQPEASPWGGEGEKAWESLGAESNDAHSHKHVTFPSQN